MLEIGWSKETEETISAAVFTKKSDIHSYVSSWSILKCQYIGPFVRHHSQMFNSWLSDCE